MARTPHCNDSNLEYALLLCVITKILGWIYMHEMDAYVSQADGIWPYVQARQCEMAME